MYAKVVKELRQVREGRDALSKAVKDLQEHLAKQEEMLALCEVAVDKGTEDAGKGRTSPISRRKWCSRTCI